MIKSIWDTAEEKLSEFEDRQKISSSQEKYCNYIWWQMLTRFHIVIISQYTCIKSLCCIPKTNTTLYINFLKNYSKRKLYRKKTTGKFDFKKK